MNLSTQNRALLRGILGGAVILSGVSACSRSNRADAGPDTTQAGAAAVTPSDTQTSASVSQPSAGAAQPSGDTATTNTRDTTTATARTQTPQQRSTTRQNAGRDTTARSGEDAVSGYRGMERDTSVAAGNPADSTRVASDSTVSTAQPDTGSAEPAGAASPYDPSGVTADEAMTADTNTAGYSEMARDTSSTAGRGDTASVAIADQARPDTSNIQVHTDTMPAEPQARADTTTSHTDTLRVAAADSADTTSVSNQQAVAQDADADTLQDNAGRIRPPEDSTEILGNVTTDSASAAKGSMANQPESERIRPPEDSTEILGNVTSPGDSTEVAGAAAIGHNATGVDAVAVMSRAGARCVVKDDSSEVWWDMADSPAALNPCGTGTMTLSLVRTGER
jgi:hypothetical protein